MASSARSAARSRTGVSMSAADLQLVVELQEPPGAQTGSSGPRISDMLLK